MSSLRKRSVWKEKTWICVSDGTLTSNVFGHCWRTVPQAYHLIGSICSVTHQFRPFVIVLESSSGLVGDQMFCLLTNGANPLLKANLSLQALLGIEEVNECSHEELDPAKFAERAPASLTSMWPRKLRTGWGSHSPCSQALTSRMESQTLPATVHLKGNGAR